MYTIQLLHTKKHTYTKPALCRMYCIHKWLHLVLQQIDFPLLKHFKIPIMLKCCALCICVNYCTVRRYKIICTFFNLLHYTHSTHSTQYTLWSLGSLCSLYSLCLLCSLCSLCTVHFCLLRLELN